MGARKSLFSSSSLSIFSSSLLIFSSLLLFLSACAPATPNTISQPALAVTETAFSGEAAPTASSTPTPPPPPTGTPLPADAVSTLFFSAQENGYLHLFAYAPGVLPLTRLTSGEWDDISPEISPDGTKLAFASSRNNYFDLYLLDLTTGAISRLTDSPAYEASPSWSPDGLWLACETYNTDNFEISIVSATQNGQSLPLTLDPASDQHPAWAPGGRQIAFSSDRGGGQPQIWVANLDTPGENRFQQIAPDPQHAQSQPVWSPDGRFLAWEQNAADLPAQVMIWDSADPLAPARPLAPGGSPAWNWDGSQIAATLEEPNQDYLTAYALDGALRLPPLAFPRLRGVTWRALPVAQIPQIFARFAASPTPLFTAQTQPPETNPLGRALLAPLTGVDAPQPKLHDALDESFNALRARISAESGWDVLASLENAYAPLTAALDPGRGDSWLYTGRAFDLNPLPLNVGWMQVYREDYNGETNWRLFVRPRAQDGSAGEPLRRRPWDFNARYTLNPLAYEQGGALMPQIPPGYWVDVTSLARAYGWQRAAAQTNWRSYFKGSLFNEFIQPGGKTWREAMLELYPPEVLITPSPVIPPTRTLTPTPTGYRYKTATPTITATPTPQPTFTPQP
ncbi:MAG: hypothetical protein Fur0035_16010 [Anaerolineales bacterium]